MAVAVCLGSVRLGMARCDTAVGALLGEARRVLAGSGLAGCGCHGVERPGEQWHGQSRPFVTVRLGVAVVKVRLSGMARPGQQGLGQAVVNIH